MLADLTKEQKLIILGLVLIICLGLVVMAFRRLAPASDGPVMIEPFKTDYVEEKMLIVHVSGAVGNPGVYKLKTNDRILDAISLAGGAGSNADLESLNLAEIIKDGQKIIVPVRKRLSKNLDNSGSGTSINTASEQELCKIPGVGKSFAQRIIAGRPYAKLEDLMKVKGIGKGKLEKMKDYISL